MSIMEIFRSTESALCRACGNAESVRSLPGSIERWRAEVKWETLHKIFLWGAQHCHLIKPGNVTAEWLLWASHRSYWVLVNRIAALRGAVFLDCLYNAPKDIVSLTSLKKKKRGESALQQETLALRPGSKSIVRFWKHTPSLSLGSHNAALIVLQIAM